MFGTLLNKDATPSKYDLSYMVVGQCNANIPPGWSKTRGLEVASFKPKATLEIIFNPSDYFDFRITADFEEGAPILEYSDDDTYFVEYISRKNGTTAGGTTLVIEGSGQGATDGFPDDLEVYLGGVRCSTQNATIGSYRGKHLCEWDGVNCEDIGILNYTVTCLTNPWTFAGDPWYRDVHLYWPNHGNALNLKSEVNWSYINLWSARTTWGMEDPPRHGDSVVITAGEYIVLDISPPKLNLLLIYGGMLEFADTEHNGDIFLNASYIMVKDHSANEETGFKGSPGFFRVGTEETPFGIETGNKAVITLEGDRKTLELPVYGAKVLALRNSVLDLHGKPKKNFVFLAETAFFGNTTLNVDQPVDWEAGDEITVSSTSWSQLETEELKVAGVSKDGLKIELSRPLYYTHIGGGWTSKDGSIHVPEYRAAVGLLSRNVIVQGSDSSNRDQFGGQLVFSNSVGDKSNDILTESNGILARLSNVEVRRAGQGLKLGKYPIHFHMVGSVPRSYVKNCSVHHLFNRAIAVHGTNDLRVHGNVVHDTRGHAIFLEDGTEVGNEIMGNLVGLVRPVWSLLLVDQSPAAYWIVNPGNRIVDNIAAGSSHYGFWFRALPEPDGQGGQHITEIGKRMCPSRTPLGEFRGNVAHSTGRHGLKISDYFPVVNGGDPSCGEDPDDELVYSEPTTFRDFVAFKNKNFGIWGEFIVDVNFDNIKCLDHGIAGMEFAYINGPESKHAHSYFENLVFVGRTEGEVVYLPSFGSTGYAQCELDPHLSRTGSVTGCVHGIHLSGIASEVTYKNVHFESYEAALWGCAWCVDLRGGYEQNFEKVTMTNVDRAVTWRFMNAGIVRDLDGSLTGTDMSLLPTGTTVSVVPPGPMFDDTEGCEIFRGFSYLHGELNWYAVCTISVRRVVIKPKFYSVYFNTETLFQFPYIQIKDITEHASGAHGSKANFDALKSVSFAKGPTSCFPQVPEEDYMILLPMNRHLSLFWFDAYDILVTGGVEIQVKDMKFNETLLFTMTMNPPYENPLYRVWTSVTSGWDRSNEQGPSKGWQGPPEIPPYKLNARAMSWQDQCSQKEFEEGAEGCEKCARGIDYLGGCAGNKWDEKTGLELARRPNIGDKTVRNKPRGMTSEGGFLSAINGWPGVGIAGDDYAATVICNGPAQDCTGAFQSHVYKSNACIAVEDFEYSYGKAVSGTIMVTPCHGKRAWKRFAAEIEDDTSCGAWGFDCLDVWRMNYDYKAITRGPQFGGVLTGSRGVDREDGWYGPSQDPNGESFYKNHTITPVNQPWLCLTQDREGSSGENDGELWGTAQGEVNDDSEGEVASFRPVKNETGTKIILEECDGSLAQQWEFTEEGWMKNLASGMCAQFTTTAKMSDRCRKDDRDKFPYSSKHNVFGANDANTMEVGMFPCSDEGFAAQRKNEPLVDYDAAECQESWMLADLTKFNPEFYAEGEVEVTHGAYYYDMTTGIQIVQNVLEFAEKRDVYDSYDLTNRSVVTLVVAGNTSATVRADDCAEEGCASPNLLGDSSEFRTFFWSDNLGWNRTGDESVDVPGYLSKVIIINTWDVMLDVTTDILDSLEIRGTLTVHSGNAIRVTLNAFYIDIKGGKFFIGNSTHPYSGAGVTVSLHGDAYVHGVKCDKKPEFSSEFEEELSRGFMVGCGKRMDVNGELFVRGRERIVESVLDGNHPSGSKVLKVNPAPMINVTAENGTSALVCDWEIGDELLVTTSLPHGFPEGGREDRGFNITSVNDDCTEFSIDKEGRGLAEDHIGIVSEEEGGVEIDMRSRCVFVVMMFVCVCVSFFIFLFFFFFFFFCTDL